MDKLALKDLLARHGVPQVDFCRAGEEGWRARRLWVRPAALGEAVAPRLERRDQPASRRGGARRGGGAGAPPRPAGDRRGARPGQGGRVLAARQRGAEASPPGEIVAHGPMVRLRGEVRARAAWSWSCRRRSPIGPRRRVRELARHVFMLGGCSGLARCDFFVDGGEVLVNEINTMPGLHRDQRLREALRGGRHRLPGALRPPRRARGRAPRAERGRTSSRCRVSRRATRLTRSVG